MEEDLRNPKTQLVIEGACTTSKGRIKVASWTSSEEEEMAAAPVKLGAYSATRC